MRTYSDLVRYDTYLDRYNYLRIGGSVGIETFGFDRIINQTFYRSKEWKSVCRRVIARDAGLDMGLVDFPIAGRILVHHMNPIREEDILYRNDDILDPEYLISVSHMTHNAIHYGSVPPKESYQERRRGDTTLW